MSFDANIQAISFFCHFAKWYLYHIFFDNRQKYFPKNANVLTENVQTFQTKNH